MKSIYYIEFDGDAYSILRNNQVIVSYRTAEAAIRARRAFEDKHMPLEWSRIPPAMLYMRQQRLS
ncbi:MAG: hypothetical protein AB7D03_11020 [Thiomicrospira sp.]